MPLIWEAKTNKQDFKIPSNPINRLMQCQSVKFSGELVWQSIQNLS